MATTRGRAKKAPSSTDNNQSPPNKKAKQNVVTPSADTYKKLQSKTRGKKYTVFKLDSGKEILFSNASHADEYEDENADIITETITFDTEQGYQEYKTSSKETSPVSATTIKTESLTSDERLALARIKKHRQAHAPSKSITLHYKTTKFSRACALALEVRDVYGKPQWNFKAKDHMAILQSYCSDPMSNVSGQHTMEIIDNLHCVERRNLEKGENDPDKKKGYMNYKLISYFIIPDDPTITTMEEEETYIKDYLQSFGKELKRIMASNLYTSALREMVSGYSKKLEKLTFEPDKGPSLQAFIQQCTVVVEPIKTYTDHIIKDKVSVLRCFLSDHDDSIPKYIPDEAITNVSNEQNNNGASFSPNFHPPPPNQEANPQMSELQSQDQDEESKHDEESDQDE